ncbi:hypothetical protein EWM64_g11000 [Hericium alpestre]|uniref:Uncharacterized protein n=1 Tax=Hericium alpestre TaxID=135208 RepID=A0A4Y9ZEJ1_9AGAM|nr:hypothetical protein EWM64_g11000 [Hericium alpestre]
MPEGDRQRSIVDSIKKDTGFKNVEVRIIDLAQFDSVVDFGAKFEQEEKRLDILFYNAGVMTRDYATTADGWETT